MTPLLRAFAFSLLLGFGLSPSAVGEGSLTVADYDRAAAALKLGELITNESLTPHFIGESDRFWYRSDDADGARFWWVDPLAGNNRRRLAFDHERLAASLSVLEGEPYEPLHLPFEAVDLSAEGRVRFEAASTTGPAKRYDCATSGDDCQRLEGDVAEPEAEPNGEEAEPPDSLELVAPNGKLALVIRGHDLYLVDKESGDERRVTHDGEPYNDYAGQPEARTSTITEKLAGLRPTPSALWTPDSSKIVTYRLDQREVGAMHVIQTTNLGESHRPVLHSFRMPIPGDEGVPMSQLIVIDVATLTVRPVDTSPAYTPFWSLIRFGQVFLSEEGDRAYLLRRPRGARSMTLEEIDLESGTSRTLLTEESTHIVEPHLTIGARPNVRVLKSGEIVWYSQRDGWAHLYLYSAGGELVRQVTRGPWVVRDIVHVDEESRRIYFSASGAGGEEDPYLRKLYVTDLDERAALRALTAEPGDHTTTASPTGRTFVDVFSAVDLPTRSRVVSASGEVLVELETADISRLEEQGISLPQPFVAKARDGKTDVYGTILFPPGFDPEDTKRQYPVIEGIYPGPQAARVAKSLHQGLFVFLPMDAALAQLGFIVVSVDGFGTPLRSKAFHARSEGNLQEAGGLPDHVAVLRQLGRRVPQMDLDRVGIYGHSGGGFASARALLAYPDVYRVAVSSAGNHDQRGYIQLWGETYHGDPETVSYEEQANASLAGQLEGKLLLAYGAMDDNVNQALTLQLIDALTKANKDYDLLVMPEANHGFSQDPYFVRRSWDYFVRHLAGKEPPRQYDLATALQ